MCCSMYACVMSVSMCLCISVFVCGLYCEYKCLYVVCVTVYVLCVMFYVYVVCALCMLYMCVVCRAVSVCGVCVCVCICKYVNM